MSAQQTPGPRSIAVVAAVIERDGRFLVTRRLDGTHLAGFWEFPGGKIGPEEGQESALRREIREELEADVLVGDRMLTTTFPYADRTVTLHFYRCTLSGDPRPRLGQAMRWASADDLRALPFPPADAELIRVLLARAHAAPDGHADS